MARFYVREFVNYPVVALGVVTCCLSVVMFLLSYIDLLVMLAFLIGWILLFWMDFKFAHLIVGKKGIRIYILHFLKWKDVKQAKRANLLGIPYMIVITRFWWQLPYWIPLSVNNNKEFKKAVVKYCPDGNPVRSVVETMDD